MSYVITVTQLTPDASGNTAQTQEVFRQCVETIDLPKLFAAANYKKRERKQRTAKTAPTS